AVAGNTISGRIGTRLRGPCEYPPSGNKYAAKTRSPAVVVVSTPTATARWVFQNARKPSIDRIVTGAQRITDLPGDPSRTASPRGMSARRNGRAGSAGIVSAQS